MEDNEIRRQIFQDISDERLEQDAVYGEVNKTIKFLPEDMSLFIIKAKLKLLRLREQRLGRQSFFDVAMEELLEAFSEEVPENRRYEFVQLCAVVVQILEKIDKGEIKE